MWFVPSPEGDIDLDGARVIDVERAPGRIRIELAGAIDVNSGVSIQRASLICENAQAERVAFYVGERVQGDVTDRVIPLDDIEVVEFTGSTLELHGYKAHKPWYVWSIDCSAVRIIRKESPGAT